MYCSSDPPARGSDSAGPRFGDHSTRGPLPQDWFGYQFWYGPTSLRHCDRSHPNPKQITRPDTDDESAYIDHDRRFRQQRHPKWLTCMSIYSTPLNYWAGYKETFADCYRHRYQRSKEQKAASISPNTCFGTIYDQWSTDCLRKRSSSTSIVFSKTMQLNFTDRLQ